MYGYESLAWIRDRHGSEYVCSVEALGGDLSDRDELSEEEQQQCMNVNLLVGTERW